MLLESAASVLTTSRRLTFKRRLPSPSDKIVCVKHLAACPVEALEAALARESKLLEEKDALIAEKELLRSESDHRLLNGLQMVGSLLYLQSRAAPTPDIAAHLSVAANRVAAIERVHRRLHFNDGTETVALKKYLLDFCADFSGMASYEADQSIMVDGCEIEVPTAAAIPLGFIANELITNAVKYGKGRIVVALDTSPDGRYAFSVSNDGPPLPAAYDPAASNGLGMKIIRALVQKIGGDFSFGQRDNNQGSRFTVRFTC